MSNFPATDIVADVAQAADPGKMRVAVKRLADLSKGADARGDGFATTLSETSSGFGNARPVRTVPIARASLTVVNHGNAGSGRMPDAARKFEAYMLQSFLEVLLPKENHDTYGQGLSGGIWRSMMAEQIGAQLAKRGVLGLDKIFEAQFGAQRIAADTKALNNEAIPHA
jgi:flagellar protein FlgJ